MKAGCGGLTRSSAEAAVMAVERRGQLAPISFYSQPVSGNRVLALAWEDESMKSKSQPIELEMVRRAWSDVRTGGPSAGVDGITMEAFEERLERNLYKLWNRMASGSYFPAAVRRVYIEKPDGGQRPLGIPTILDRVAQTVVKHQLEPELENVFSENSYGYRPGRDAHQAVAKARQMCWRYPWVIDLDIKGFFDTIDHDLLMRAVRKKTDQKWMLMYIERWLKAPIQTEDGKLEYPDMGTPQGGVISPLLANLFLHYGFDRWMEINHPRVEFERYADDIVVHCATKEKAVELLEQIRGRMAEIGLSLHPRKTRIVYCNQGHKPLKDEHTSFDFLGFTFRPRVARRPNGDLFMGFSPAISNKAKKRIRAELKALHIPRRADLSIKQIAWTLNRELIGWYNYYGKFRPYQLCVLWRAINTQLCKWARKRYKQFRYNLRKYLHWIRSVYRRSPKLFAHWQWYGPTEWG